MLSLETQDKPKDAKVKSEILQFAECFICGVHFGKDNRTGEIRRSCPVCKSFRNKRYEIHTKYLKIVFVDS